MRGNDIEIDDSYNGLAVQDLRIRNEETFTIKKRAMEIPRESLLTNEGAFNPRLEVIIKELFSRFSTDGLMSKNQCGKFRGVCINDPECDENDKKIAELYKQIDDDNDGFLTEQNFLEFYLTSAKTTPTTVYKNIEAFNYRPDLKRSEEVEAARHIVMEALPRYLMSKTTRWYDILFKLLDYKEEIAEKSFEILRRLETSERIMEEIRTLKVVKQGGVWEMILHSTSSHRLAYELHVIEYLMQKDLEGWKKEFIELGGFEHLYVIFNRLIKEEDLKSNKGVISYILKIFKTYIIIAFTFEKPRLSKDIDMIKEFNMSLEEIAKNMKLTLKNHESSTEVKEYDIVKINRKKSLEMLESNAPKTLSSNMNDKDYESLLALYQCNSQEKSKDEKTVIEEKVEITNKKEDFEEEKIAINNEVIPAFPSSLAKKIVDMFDLKSLLESLMAFITEILSKNHDFELEDRNIIEYSLSLLLGILLYSPQFLTDFLKKADFLIISGLFSPHSSLIRRLMANFLYILLTETLESTFVPLKHMIQQLLEYLPTTSLKDSLSRECEQYHELICQLIEEALTLPSEQRDTILEISQISQRLIKGLLSHISMETRDGKVTDRVLIGLLKLCQKFMAINPNKEVSMALTLFDALLFNTEDSSQTATDYYLCENTNVVQTVKCKANESRKMAYNLVLELCKVTDGSGGEALLSLIMKGLGPLMDRIGGVLNAEKQELFKNTGFNYIPSNSSKSSYGYVGIKNLGCICYMNAMLQQFFMTPSFRYALLMINDLKPTELVPHNKEITRMVDDNILHQLQYMFGFLELSDRMDYNPLEFCFAFKDFQGLPVNVCIQQDSQEFVNMIFDKLEHGIKGTSFEGILEDVFGGKSCTQLICSECGKKKEKEELFYNLSLEVKNMKNLYESVEKYIQGETISDYHCEGCQKKVQTMKRSILSKVPNVLIVHLQRIVFDLDSLQNEKISTRLEFPFELDLYNYSYEKIEQPDKAYDASLYRYKLVGVVVHIGTAQYGHYYSYINIKRDLQAKDPKNAGKYEDKWLEFNDSLVKDFDPKNIETECFGGTVDSRDDWGWGSSSTRSENSKSAYMLIYEREKKTAITLKLNENDEKMRLSKELLAYLDIVAEKTGENENKQYLLDYFNIKPFVQKGIHQKVLQDNSSFMFERHLFNEQFFKFVSELLNSIKLPELTPSIYSIGYEPAYESIDKPQKRLFCQLIEIIYRLIYELLARATDNSLIMEFSSLLKHLLYLNPDYIVENFERFVMKKSHKEYVLICQDRSVRTYCSSILLHMINITIAFKGIKLGSIEEEGLSAKVKAFLDEFLAIVAKGELQKHATKLQQYFEVYIINKFLC